MDEAFDLMGRVVLSAARVALSFVGVGVGTARRAGANRRPKDYIPASLRPGGKLELSEHTAVYTVTVPRAKEWDAAKAQQLMTLLISTFDHVAFRVIGEANRISWQVIDLGAKHDPEAFQRAIHAVYPGCNILTAKLKSWKVTQPFLRLILPVLTVMKFPVPLRSVEELKKADPLVYLTQSMNDLKEGERIIYTLWVAGPAEGAEKVGREMITRRQIDPVDYASLDTALLSEIRNLRGGNLVPAFEGQVQRVLEDKLARPLYSAFLILQFDMPDPDRAEALLTAAAQLTGFENLPYNLLDTPAEEKELPYGGVVEVRNEGREQESDTLSLIRSWLTDKNDRWKDFVMILEARELAALWHLPNARFTASDIEWQAANQVAASRSFFAPEVGVLIGDNEYGGQRNAVYLPQSERTSHAAIIGKTGVGKSSLLHTMIAQDIRAGRGVAVIDPTGSLVRDVLRWSIPEARYEDVVVLDIAHEFETEQGKVYFPPPMNLLARPEGVEADIAAGMLTAVLEKIYESDLAATQMGHTLATGLATLAYEEHPTLLDIDRLFQDAVYREELKSKIDNVALARSWDRFEALSHAEQERMLYPLLRRLDAFYSNRLLYPITCHPDTINIAELMAQNKIILVSLHADEAKVREVERMVLGATIISQIQMAAMAKAIRKPPYLLYIDETQHFVTTSLQQMFEQARKFGLGLVIANQQYFKQLAGETLEAVMGTVGSLIAFECHESDATILAPYVKPQLDAKTLVTLGKYRAVVSARAADGSRHTFTLETRDAPVSERAAALKEATQREEYIRLASVENYTPKSYSEVKRWLDARYNPPRPRSSGDDADGFIEPRR